MIIKEALSPNSVDNNGNIPKAVTSNTHICYLVLPSNLHTRFSSSQFDFPAIWQPFRIFICVCCHLSIANDDQLHRWTNNIFFQERAQETHLQMTFTGGLFGICRLRLFTTVGGLFSIAYNIVLGEELLPGFQLDVNLQICKSIIWVPS